MTIKILLQRSYAESPYPNDYMAYEIEVPIPKDWGLAHIVASRSYSEDKSSDIPRGDINTVTLSYKDESNMVGKVLTHIDATFVDKEQRDAQKSIVKEILYGMFNNLHNEATRMIDSYNVVNDIKAQDSVRR